MRVLTVFGTRPEAIKLAPVISLLDDDPDIESIVCVTGQHREMLDQMLKLFDIHPDYDLDVMSKSQSLFDITTRALNGVGEVIECSSPNVVLVHGDTTTTFAASLAAFYHQVPVAHVEAGLRTRDLYAPWPEEANRRLTDAISKLHFAPTSSARESLLIEGVPESSIFVTGNTVIDSLLNITEKITVDTSLQHELDEKLSFIEGDNKIVLITGHRRESYGSGFEIICNALVKLSDRYQDVQFVYPVHLNPRVREPVLRLLQGRSNIKLVEPLDYLPFVYLMMKSYLILTDSGGIQEEAPSLDKPVLVMREKTERAEAINTGVAKLVGVDTDAIVDAVSLLIDDPNQYAAMTGKDNPYGDGRAAIRIRDQLKRFNDG